MSTSIEITAEATGLEASPARGRARTLDIGARPRNVPSTPSSTRNRRLPRLEPSESDSSLPELSQTNKSGQALGSLLSRQRGGRQQVFSDASPALEVVSKRR